MLARLDPQLVTIPQKPQGPAVSLRYLGTAGFVVSGAARTLVIDPFVTRPGLLTSAFRRLVPDAVQIAERLPKADEVLVGHAHHDHVLDAPELCRQTGARFVGSPSACNVARAAGLPEAQLVCTRGREYIPCGPTTTIYGAPSRHGRVYFGRVTLPGTISQPPIWPPRMWDLRHGQVLNWHIEVDGVRIVHIDSADFCAEELAPLRADVLCLCAIGRRYRPNYVRDAVRILQPRYVVACHWDWFFTRYDATPRLLPGVDLAGFLTEISETGAQPVLMPFDGEFAVATKEGEAGAVG